MADRKGVPPRLGNNAPDFPTLQTLRAYENRIKGLDSKVLEGIVLPHLEDSELQAVIDAMKANDEKFGELLAQKPRNDAEIDRRFELSRLLAGFAYFAGIDGDLLTDVQKNFDASLTLAKVPPK